MERGWQTLDSQTSFIVVQREWVEALDQEVLAYLYQPLIHASGYALYQALLSLVEVESHLSLETRHRDILERLVISKEIYYEARTRLEALGLLRVFRQQEAGQQLAYRYDLYAPLRPERFFRDSLLSTLLLDRLGQQTYERLEARFSHIWPEHLKNIAWEEETLSFQDVYRLPSEHLEEAASQHLLHSNQGRPPLTTSSGPRTFSWSYFKALFQDSLLPQQALTGSLQDLVLTLHKLYGYDETELFRLCFDAYDFHQKKLDADMLKRRAQEYAEATRSSRRQSSAIAPEETKTDQIEAALAEAGLPQAASQVVAACENYAPDEFLTSIKRQRQGQVLPKERKLLTDLLTRFHLPESLYNAMIYYYLIELDNSTLNWGFLQRLADDWQQQGLKNSLEAFLYIKNRQDQKAKQQKEQAERYKKRYVYEETQPDWLIKAKKEQKNGQSRREVSDRASQEQARHSLIERIKAREREGEEE